MNKNEQDIIKNLKAAVNVRMTDAERAKTREFLARYMDMKPLPTHLFETTAVQSSGVTWSLSVFSMRISAFAAALMLVVSGGTAIAAEGAMPGDLLYPVKVGVTEEVRSAFALSAESRADWAIERAERRLAEAAMLAAGDRLDAETRTNIDTNLQLHIADARMTTDKLRSSNKFESAISAEIELEAVLTAQEHVLSSVRASSQNASVRAQVDAVIAGIRTSIGSPIAAHTRSAAAAPMAVEVEDAQADAGVEIMGIAMMQAESAPADAKAEARADVSSPEEASMPAEAVEGRRAAAESRIEAAEDYFDRFASRVRSEIRAEAQTMLNAAQEAYAAGEAALEAGDTGEAHAQFISAFRTAVEVQTFLATNIRLRDILGFEGRGTDPDPEGPGVQAGSSNSADADISASGGTDPDMPAASSTLDASTQVGGAAESVLRLEL